ncbi:MAG: hypothetical protein SGILL_002710 [Bacillariaceae sp.]
MTPASSLLSEVSGACGDFGTLIPLLVAMARGRTIYLAPTLFLSGVVHILTGLYWDIPMPLQPMKAIASLAIAQELSRIQVTTAGVGIGICFLLLSIKGAIDFVNKWIPLAVIGGLQLGVGWKLALKGIHMIQQLPWWFASSVDCISLAILCGLLCLYGLRRKVPSPSNQRQDAMTEEDNEEADETDSTIPEASEISTCQRLLLHPPVGIILFLLGIILAIIQVTTNNSADNPNDSATPEPLLVNALRNATASDWRIGLVSGTLTQLPLTTLNSCLSVCMLAHTLFPAHNKIQRLSRQSVCISIGLVNALLCPLGMMPTCHGAGGLAGQHKLGANTGVSMVLLGVFKMALGILACQGSLLRILDALPASILGILLVVAGHELAMTGVVKVAESSSLNNNNNNNNNSGRGNGNTDSMSVCLITALVIVGTGHTHVGALSGWIACVIQGSNGFSLCGRSGEGNATSNERSSSRGEYAVIQSENAA